MEPKPPKDDLQSAAPPAKKAYKTPVLVTWGTMKDITLTNSGSHSHDGGKKSNAFTS